MIFRDKTFRDKEYKGRYAPETFNRNKVNRQSIPSVLNEKENTQQQYTYKSLVAKLEKKGGRTIHFAHKGTIFAVGVHLILTRMAMTTRRFIFSTEIEYDAFEALFARARLDAQTISERYADLPPFEGDKKRQAYEDFFDALILQGLIELDHTQRLSSITKLQKPARHVTKYSISTTKYSVDTIVGYACIETLLDKLLIDGKRIEDIFDELDFMPFARQALEE